MKVPNTPVVEEQQVPISSTQEEIMNQQGTPPTAAEIVVMPEDPAPKPERQNAGDKKSLSPTEAIALFLNMDAGAVQANLTARTSTGIMTASPTPRPTSATARTQSRRAR